MRINRASRRVRWAVPAGALIALAIAIPSGVSFGADNGNSGNTGNTGNSGTAANAQNSANNGSDSGTGNDPNFPASFTPPFLHQVALVSFPTPYTATASFDIGWVDANTHVYYLADRTNAGVDVVTTSNDQFQTVLGGTGVFAGAKPTVSTAQTAACGTAVAGPNGVLSLTVGGVNQVWAGDGVTATTTSSVKVITLDSTGTKQVGSPTTISTADSADGTAGVCRADEMGYDAADHVLLVANDADSPPYVTGISVNANPAMDKILYQDKFPAPATGIEQTVWNPRNDRFYTNLPGEGLAVINPKTGVVDTTYAQPNCNSSGLALDVRNQTMLSACSINPFGSMLMSAKDGSVLARFPQVSGSDENWYDPGTNTFYLGANHMSANLTSTGIPTPVIGVIGAGGRGRGNGARWLSNWAAGATTNNTHSVAADPNNGQVFVPMAGIGIAVLTDTSAATGL